MLKTWVKLLVCRKLERFLEEKKSMVSTYYCMLCQWSCPELFSKRFRTVPHSLNNGRFKWCKFSEIRVFGTSHEQHYHHHPCGISQKCAPCASLLRCQDASSFENSHLMKRPFGVGIQRFASRHASSASLASVDEGCFVWTPVCQLWARLSKA